MFIDEGVYLDTDEDGIPEFTGILRRWMKMKPVKTFHLLCEERFSFGRLVALAGVIGLCIGFLLADLPSIENGTIYHYDLQTRVIEIFGYVFLFS